MLTRTGKLNAYPVVQPERYNPLWLLVVFVGGMTIYSNTYPTLSACEAAGRAEIIARAKFHKQGVGYNCTRQLR